MKKIVIILALLFLQISCLAVYVETTNNLKVYYTKFTKIVLVCGQMPKTSQKNVEFCRETTFTGELQNKLK